jgi:predicted metal-dependent hydrolase
MRARDAAGRPVPAGSPDAFEPVPEQALPPQDALALARELLAQGRPFFAHDVLEARWKAAPDPERDLWQGLAQVCVGLTHLQRGNPVGGARLLRRGAQRLAEWSGPSYGVDVPAVVTAAQARADAVEAGAEGPEVVL